MTHVETGSRLHFGLFRLPPAGPWPANERYFGGCGLMLREPAVRVAVAPAADWSADGPSAGRALEFARRLAAAHPGRVPPHRVAVEACPPEHAGLGAGTQLALAVGRALERSAGLPESDAADLARRVGRGGRSALGVHGFGRGGLLVEGGKRRPDDLAPLLVRAEFPADWRVVLFRPESAGDWHGPRERAAFDALAGGAEAAVTDRLARLALLGLLPALAERDADAFGEALFEFNALAGELFRPVQGGTYASPAVAEVVDWARRQGARGVGQSSWGPTVFAVAADAERAADWAARFAARAEGPGYVTVSEAVAMQNAK